LCCLAVLAAPGAAAGQAESGAPFDRTASVALRIGVAASSGLFEDAVGPGANAVTGSPDAGLVLGVSATLPLRPRLDLEAELGWSGVSLEAEDGLATWTVDDLTILHGGLLLRWHLTSQAYGRGGVGVIRHTGDREDGLLADDAQVDPYATVGVGLQRSVGRARLFAELNGQAHPFAFAALRAAGGERGIVWRGLLQAGASLPIGGGS
jgi:hypothetical protein